MGKAVLTINPWMIDRTYRIIFNIDYFTFKGVYVDFTEEGIKFRISKKLQLFLAACFAVVFLSQVFVRLVEFDARNLAMIILLIPMLFIILYFPAILITRNTFIDYKEIEEIRPNKLIEVPGIFPFITLPGVVIRTDKITYILMGIGSKNVDLILSTFKKYTT